MRSEETRPSILVTGGAGYIGSHTCVELLNADYRVTVLDNFSNSRPTVLSRIREITGRDLDLVEADLLDLDALEQAFARHAFDSVIHFAGVKSVSESAIARSLSVRNLSVRRHRPLS